MGKKKKTILMFDVVSLLLLFCFGHKPTYVGPGFVTDVPTLPALTPFIYKITGQMMISPVLFPV